MNFDLYKGFFFALIIVVISLLFFQHWIDTTPSNDLYSPNSADVCSSEERTNSTSYRYETSCAIKSKEHLSAIKRTHSDYCKKQIADLACRSVDAADGIGDLYPSNLPNLCLSARTLNPKLKGKYLGNTIHR